MTIAQFGDELTETEIAVVGWLAHGLTYKEISVKRACSVGAVKFHVVNVFKKLGVSKQTQAVVEALRRKLVALPEHSLSVRPVSRAVRRMWS